MSKYKEWKKKLVSEIETLGYIDWDTMHNAYNSFYNGEMNLDQITKLANIYYWNDTKHLADCKNIKI